MNFTLRKAPPQGGGRAEACTKSYITLKLHLILSRFVRNKMLVGQSVEPKLIKNASLLSVEVVGVEQLFSKLSEPWRLLGQVKDTLLGLIKDHIDLYCVSWDAS